ncbi:MAG: hypothetical protein ACLRMN_13320 [Mediterraneibacter gnavus]
MPSIRPLGATTMDGVKRRTRAGMGRSPVWILQSENDGDPGAGIENQTGRDYEKRSRFRDDRGEESRWRNIRS